MPDAGYLIPDAGCRIPDAGYLMPDALVRRELGSPRGPRPPWPRPAEASGQGVTKDSCASSDERFRLHVPPVRVVAYSVPRQKPLEPPEPILFHCCPASNWRVAGLPPTLAPSAPLAEYPH